jgi:hypothetical protein
MKQVRGVRCLGVVDETVKRKFGQLGTHCEKGLETRDMKGRDTQLAQAVFAAGEPLKDYVVGQERGIRGVVQTGVLQHERMHAGGKRKPRGERRDRVRRIQGELAETTKSFEQANDVGGRRFDGIHQGQDLEIRKPPLGQERPRQP